MSKTHNHESSEETHRRALEFSSAFKAMTEIEGIAIKGHIMIERELNAAIENFCLHPEHYKADRFTFSEKLAIALMIGIATPFEKEIRAINKVRNQIAHSLTHDPSHIQTIIDGVSTKYPEVSKTGNGLTTLTNSISFICGALSLGARIARLNLSLDEVKKRRKIED